MWVRRAQAPRSRLNTLLLDSDFMLSVIFASTVPTNTSHTLDILGTQENAEALCPTVRPLPKQDLVSYSSSLLPRGTIATPRCPSAQPATEPIPAGLPGLSQDLQQLLYPVRSCSFNRPYKLDLPERSLSCRPIFVYKEIYAATQFQPPAGPFYCSASVKTLGLF